MARIHGPDGGPNVRPPQEDGTQWAPFTDTTMIETVRAALAILRDQTAKVPGCDGYFTALPNKISFKQALEDQTVWISFDPTGPDYGATVGKDITVSKEVVAMGKWKLAALLVHELAHVAGATDVNDQAENSIYHCGLKEHVIKETKPPKPEPPDAKLRVHVVGAWRATIGDWKGYFVFSDDGTCSWRSVESAQLHLGSWKTTATEVQWTFNDDPKGWERLFRIRLPFAPKIDGIDGFVTIQDAPHGFFKMVRYTFR